MTVRNSSVSLHAGVFTFSENLVSPPVGHANHRGSILGALIVALRVGQLVQEVDHVRDDPPGDRKVGLGDVARRCGEHLMRHFLAGQSHLAANPDGFRRVGSGRYARDPGGDGIGTLSGPRGLKEDGQRGRDCPGYPCDSKDEEDESAQVD